MQAIRHDVDVALTTREDLNRLHIVPDEYALGIGEVFIARNALLSRDRDVQPDTIGVMVADGDDNPTPVTMPWITRLSSVPVAAWIDRTAKAEPRHTRPSVRTPVDLPCRSRLSPSRTPTKVATPSRTAMSRMSIAAQF